MGDVANDPLHEIECPKCGTTIRARMADAPSTQQPLPQHVRGRGYEARSVHDIVGDALWVLGDDAATAAARALMAERKAFGLAKYGTVLQLGEPNRVASLDLLEELADAVVYARRVLHQVGDGDELAERTYRVLARMLVETATAWFRQ